MQTTAATYRLISSNLARSLGNTAKQPQVARETEYYLANIGKVKSVTDFMSNERLYRYVMKAFSLDDMTYAKAFVRKALTEGIDDRTSFANRLTDPRFRELVATFNFARYGADTTASDLTRQAVVDRHLHQMLEENAGKQNEGVRLALYFQRKASGIQSAFNILGNKALLKVVQTVLRLPVSMSQQDIDRQAKLITDRLDLDDFANPDKLNKFLNRFTAMWELENPTSAPTTPSIQIGQPASIGIGQSLLTVLQNLRPGGR
ncbi:MAG: DUF1217 domain-containing protein [Hyphomicrobiaceae bacterium]